MTDNPLNVSVNIVPCLTEWSARFRGWAFLRAESGSGYLLHPAPAREFNAGDTAILAPGVAATLRASQLEDLQLESFEVDPGHLGGLLTVPERAWLERHALDPGQQVRVVGADRLSQLGLVRPAATNGAVHGPFRLRFERLHFAARLLDAELPAMGGALGQRDERIDAVLASLTEKELRRMTAGEMAERCGCSQRHFRRLFQKRFKTTLRSRLVTIRLENARRLLAESDEKIVQVAMESGFRNLSLFNVLFKRHFGLTPSAWRRQSHARRQARDGERVAPPVSTNAGK